MSRLSALLAALGALVLAAPAAAATAPTSAALHHAAVNGATIGYRVLNPHAGGPALVLVPGYGVTMAEWDPRLVERLARGRRVVELDNRGIGTSSGPVAGLTIGTMADDTIALMRRLHLRRADVLGWSMGGYIAQEVARRAPGAVRRLVLASTDPGSPRAIEPTARVVAVLTAPTLSPTSLLPVLFPADQQAAGRAWLAAVAAQPNLTAADFSTPPKTMSEQEAANATRWYARGHGTYGRLPRMRARTLVAFGREDRVVPPGNARLLGRRIPHATLSGYADAGHAFLFQRPAAKAAAFARFLDRR
jgi:pimeloyl-ACP methyl ester carboxylesterase